MRIQAVNMGFESINYLQAQVTTLQEELAMAEQSSKNSVQMIAIISVDHECPVTVIYPVLSEMFAL